MATRGEASGAAVQRVGAAVCCAVERFVAVGETIADDNPDVRHSMVLACKEARAAGMLLVVGLPPTWGREDQNNHTRHTRTRSETLFHL